MSVCVSSNQFVFEKSYDVRRRGKKFIKIEFQFFLRNSKGRQERGLMIKTSRNSQRLNFIIFV